jgi:tetratricopeptide (TPR) repeat protein
MTGAMPRTPPPSAAFLGREAELRLLVGGLEEARQGRGSLFLIGGEPGIGKSRLVAELASIARDHDVPVLWGRVWEGGGAPAYWPWIQVLRAQLRAAGADRFRKDLGAGAADVAHLLPEIRTLVDQPLLEAVESDAARFQLFDSVTSLLRGATGDGPLVLVVEDIHAADTPSILLLRFLASQLADMGLLVVGTYRDVELGPEHPLTPAVEEMAREPVVRRIGLGGLATAEIARMVEALTGHGSDERLVTGLWRRTHGNPLFLNEALRLLTLESRHLEEWPGDRRLTLPTSVREAIIRRVQQLPSPTRRVLSVAAVLGPEFDRAVLSRATEGGARAVVGALDEATAAGLVVQIGPGRHRFAHALVREAIYDVLGVLERSRIHAQIAQTLEQLREGASEELLPELAHHYFEAAQGAGADDPSDTAMSLAATAMGYAREAAEQATASLAYEEAARLYGMALQLLRRERQDNPMARLDLLLALGDAHVRAGDLPRAQTVLLEAGRLARRHGAARQLAEAALGYGGRFIWVRAGDDPHLVPMLQDALVMLGGQDDRLRVRLLSRLACAWRSSPEHFEQSDAMSEQALELAHRLGDPSTIGYALVGRIGAIWWPHTNAAREKLVRELTDVAEQAGDMERAIDSHMTMSFVRAETGRMTEAWIEIETMDRLAQELRQPAQLWLGKAVTTCFYLMSGDYARAERLMAIESRPGYPSGPISDDVSANRMHRFLLAREKGELTDAEASVRATASEFPWYAVHRTALIHTLLDNGQTERARALFEDLAHDDFGTLARDNEWLLVMAMAGEACYRLGDATRATTLYAQLREFAGLHALGVPEGSVGAVDRYLGLLAATLGQLDDAARHLTEAIRLNEQMGARPWTAHSQADLAGVLRQRRGPGDVAQAAELERAALAAAEQIGMTALAGRLRAVVGTVAVEPVPGAAAAAMFRREGEYWTIAFAGDGFRLRDARGLRYLVRLLVAPGREILALDLAREEGSAGHLSRPPGDADLRSTELTDAGDVLDAEAKAAYRDRLRELQAELDEAEGWNDPERADRARSEMEFIARELSRAVGLGGSDRVSGSPSERARLAVTRAIRRSMTNIAEHSGALGDHLETTIQTGTYCAYRPDPRAPIEWQT